MEARFPEVLLRRPRGGAWLRFAAPHAVLAARTTGEVLPVLRETERLVETRGWHAAGWIGYEAAPAFDRALQTRPPGGFPLVWFGLFPDPQEFPGPAEDRGSYALESWSPSVSRSAYAAAVAAVRNRIARGDTYQVNYTMRMRSGFRGSPGALFRDMAAAQDTAYAAFADTGGAAVASASPELFFRLEGEDILCRPMKGTARRGRTTAEDRAQAERLAASEKDRAENVMIVDMIRNDLGRVAATGSVTVTELFATERYPTLWQMTSTVTAATRAPFVEILAALFPCASITGAPKVSTMRIIAELEDAPRGVYTGAVGFLAPGRRAQFNVAIRTVAVDRAARTAEYGVGGGVVWDSTGEGEYEEALLKARVITARRPAFSLLETLRWTPREGFFLRELHLARVLDSADYFGFRADRAAIAAALDDAAAGFGAEPRRVRLLLAPDGTAAVESSALPPAPGRPLRVGLAAFPVRAADPLLFHKTTHRGVYERARAGRPDCDDVLLYNERGQLTESTIANLVLELDGERVTPPLECGLLPGTLRAHLLASGQVRERVVPRERLGDCAGIWLVNSVRGALEAVFVPERPAPGSPGEDGTALAAGREAPADRAGRSDREA